MHTTVQRTCPSKICVSNTIIPFHRFLFPTNNVKPHGKKKITKNHKTSCYGINDSPCAGTMWIFLAWSPSGSLSWDQWHCLNIPLFFLSPAIRFGFLSPFISVLLIPKPPTHSSSQAETVSPFSEHLYLYLSEDTFLPPSGGYYTFEFMAALPPEPWASGEKGKYIYLAYCRIFHSTQWTAYYWTNEWINENLLCKAMNSLSWKNYETASVEIGGSLKKNQHMKYYSSEYTKNILFTHSIRMVEGFYPYFPLVWLLIFLALF